MAPPPPKRPVSDTKTSKAPPRRLPPPQAKAPVGKPPAPPKRPAEAPTPAPKEDELDLEEGWSAPPPSIRLSGPPSRRLKASLAPMEVDPAWVSLHSIAPAPPISVRMPAAAKKGPPPLPPPPKLTIPVESNWIDDEAHDDPDAAARAALLQPKGAKPPPIPRMPKK